MGKEKLTTEEFVRRARLVHGDKYDYSNVIYVRGKDKVRIICPIHGEFAQRAADHLKGCECEKCGAIKRNTANTKTREWFISRAQKIHGDKYDYSNVIYTKSREKVLIRCKSCGNVFSIKANQHLCGTGCRLCAKKHAHDWIRGKERKDIKGNPYGVGINDYNLSTNKLVSYRRWTNMLQRCYDKKYHIKKPTYIGCSVSKEWLHFTRFKEWFDLNYIEGYVLDKDILVKGNKVYSPQTCCFVPTGINSLLTKRDKCRGEYPIGVRRTPKGKFQAIINIYGSKHSIGTFDTIEESFNAYKMAKEKHIKDVAQEYFNKGLIAENVYQALLNYEIEITD